MDTFLWGNPASEWPYFTDENPQPDRSADLRLAGSFPTFTGGLHLSLQAHLNTTTRIAYSPTVPSPNGCYSMSSSGYSGDESYHSSNESSSIPSHACQTLFSATETCNHDTRPRSHLTHINTHHNYCQSEFNKPRNLSMDYILDYPQATDRDCETWQSDLTEPDWDACSPESYQLILEGIDRMDAYMLPDGVASCEDSPDDRSDLQGIVEGSEERFSHAGSQISTSTGLSNDLLASIPPVVVDETNPEASEATVATKTVKSPDQSRTDHSVVEKRYRDNLNAKFCDLQQCVPTLPVDTDDRCGPRVSDAAISDLGKAAKLQKGEILSRAVDYIGSLSARTSGLETHIELLERRITVLQRIALQKTKRVGIGSKPTDTKSHRVSAARTPISPTSPFAEVSQPTGGASRSPNNELDQAVPEKTLKRAFSKTEGQIVNSSVTQNEPSPTKRRKFSRAELTRVARSSLAGLGLVGMLQSCWCHEQRGTACLAT